MKKISSIAIVIISAIFGATKMNAQDYLLNYGPGSAYWCAQQQQINNAMAMQNAMMGAQLLAYYRQQAAAASYHLMTNPFQPMPGIVTNDGAYITPDTVNEYHKEEVPCEHCNGGHNYRTVWYGGDKIRQVKSTCSFCHGKGYVTKTVRN